MRKVVLAFLSLLSVKGFCQQFFATAVNTNNTFSLYTINTNNCSITSAISTFTAFADIAQTPNGNLYAVNGGIWYQINTITGSFTLLPASPPNTGSTNLVALDNNTLLFIQQLRLYGYHINNGSIIDMGLVGHNASGDLCWYDNALYFTKEVDTSTFLMKIILNSSNTAVQSVTQISNSSNPLPADIFGLISSPFEDAINMLVGASYGNLYKICPYDGSFELLCTPLSTIYQISGMDAIRLPIQDPAPTICPNLSSSDFTNNTHVLLYPNPVSKDGLLHINTNSNTPITIKISNSLGLQLYNKTHTDNSDEINIGKLFISSGLYFVEIVQNQKTKTYKLMVE